MNKTKRRPLTPSELKHAEKLRGLIEQWQIERRANKERWGLEAIAEQLDMSQSAFSQFKDGKIAPNLKKWTEICDFFGVQLIDIGADLAAQAASLGETAGVNEDNTFTDIKRFNVQASAGQGRLVFDYEGLEPFKVRTDFLLSQGGNGNNSFFMQVKGDSMDPAIPDGADILVVETSDNLINGKIYVFFLNKEIYIKSLNKADAGIMATSDNRDYDPIFISKGDDFKLIGRVIMCSYKL